MPTTKPTIIGLAGPAGIEASKGAQLELHIARELGMPVHQADKLLAWLQRNGGDSHQATTFHTTKP